MIARWMCLEWLSSSGRGIPVAHPVGYPVTTITHCVSANVLAAAALNWDGTPPVPRGHLTPAEAHHD
jgi:hypothetical protein